MFLKVLTYEMWPSGWSRKRLHLPILALSLKLWGELEEAMMTNLTKDSFGRQIDYLRISVTDRCNFRCVYCMPQEGISLLPQSNILSFEEITRIARLFLEIGGQKIKLTGGEPLTQKGIVNLVRMISSLQPIADFGLTTNGFYLKKLAHPLFEAGLKRVNVSLDSMNAARFTKLTDSSSWNRVWEGINEALRVGLRLKINVVAMKGITEKELFDFGQLVVNYSIDVRFIEFMPLCGTGWHPEWMLPLKTIEKHFQDNYQLVPLPRGSATAKTYQIEGGLGKIGFIASMTEPFCDRCSRLRLSADGKLRPCLFSDAETDLKDALRTGASDEKIKGLIRDAIWRKPKGHEISPQIESAVGLPRIRSIGG